MAEHEHELTREGYDRLAAELNHLETMARRDIADAILEAREHGDLSENAEYHAAKEEQGHLEARIARLRSPAQRGHGRRCAGVHRRWPRSART